MATARTRSLAASAIGWVIVIVIIWIVLRVVIGTLFWLLRAVLVIGAIVGLVALYLWLKDPPDD